MKTIEIKASQLMTEDQALTIAEGDKHKAWILMEGHNSNADRLMKQAYDFEHEYRSHSPYQEMEKVWSYEYDYTKQDLEEIALVESFTKAIRGTQAYIHAPYFFSVEDVEWNDIPF